MTPTLNAFRTLRRLLGVYLALGVATLAVAGLLRHHPAVVGSAVWTRSTIVVATGALLFAFVARAERGSRPAYRRLRIISAATVVAIVVIVAVPGMFPVWLRVEQSAAGLVMLGVAAIANGPRLRAAFAPRPAPQPVG
jgi:hypothetical protein